MNHPVCRRRPLGAQQVTALLTCAAGARLPRQTGPSRPDSSDASTVGPKQEYQLWKQVENRRRLKPFFVAIRQHKLHKQAGGGSKVSQKHEEGQGRVRG